MKLLISDLPGVVWQHLLQFVHPEDIPSLCIAIPEAMCGLTGCQAIQLFGMRMSRVESDIFLSCILKNTHAIVGLDLSNCPAEKQSLLPKVIEQCRAVKTLHVVNSRLSLRDLCKTTKNHHRLEDLSYSLSLKEMSGFYECEDFVDDNNNFSCLDQNVGNTLVNLYIEFVDFKDLNSIFHASVLHFTKNCTNLRTVHVHQYDYWANFYTNPYVLSVPELWPSLKNIFATTTAIPVAEFVQLIHRQHPAFRECFQNLYKYSYSGELISLQLDCKGKPMNLIPKESYASSKEVFIDSPHLYITSWWDGGNFILDTSKVKFLVFGASILHDVSHFNSLLPASLVELNLGSVCFRETARASAWKIFSELPNLKALSTEVCVWFCDLESPIVLRNLRFLEIINQNEKLQKDQFARVKCPILECLELNFEVDASFSDWLCYFECTQTLRALSLQSVCNFYQIGSFLLSCSNFQFFRCHISDVVKLSKVVDSLAQCEKLRFTCFDFKSLEIGSVADFQAIVATMPHLQDIHIHGAFCKDIYDSLAFLLQVEPRLKLYSSPAIVGEYCQRRYPVGHIKPKCADYLLAY